MQVYIVIGKHLGYDLEIISVFNSQELAEKRRNLLQESSGGQYHVISRKLHTKKDK